MSTEGGIDLGSAPSLVPTANRYRILALSGGGYRGLFTARVLADLEKKAFRPLSEVFDLICGTSIGGILAAGLALGKSAEELAQSLEKHGPAIFPKSVFRTPKSFFTSRYDSTPLYKSIEGILSSECELAFSDIKKGLLVTSVSHTLAAPRIFKSYGLCGRDSDTDRLIDALMATSAAPTYFPPHNDQGNLLIDGGLVANAPDLLAITQTVGFARKQLSDCWMLSIGTVSPESARQTSNGVSRLGIIKWLTTKGLFDVTLATQERLAVSETQHLLSGRYLRIDPKPSTKQAKCISLDKADQTATDTLNLLAKNTINDLDSHQLNLLNKIIL